MLPLLIDEGLSPRVADGLRALGLDVTAVGGPGAPPRGSTDDVNIAWCAERSAVLVTNDHGKKDKTIFASLDVHRVHAIHVDRELRALPPHHLALALLRAEQALDDLASRRGLVRHRLSRTGKLTRRS